MSPRCRGRPYAAHSSLRFASKAIVARASLVKTRVANMDITDLNLFVWCKFLRHLGRTIMLLIVMGIVTLAAYSTISSALIPGMESTNTGTKAGYAVLTALYISVVCKYPSHSLHSFTFKVSSLLFSCTENYTFQPFFS